MSFKSAKMSRRRATCWPFSPWSHVLCPSAVPSVPLALIWGCKALGWPHGACGCTWDSGKIPLGGGKICGLSSRLAAT